MPKILPNSLSSQTKKELSKSFYDFVSSLSRKETEDFFHDFLTESEKIILARRLKIVKMLLQGFTQVAIRKRLGVGVSTIQFVRKWIKNEAKHKK